ncbi:uncharacterized protein MYCFIDRAFT_211390 [Pseudocercospora fijiensis CIRAD86]|uniref:Uncharacterized protein n=1 Tax=Pseudocercospora fijiensis (strain CIRAD86) TaxID=383855 RepID=M3B2U9_PSEFD|nr:uncharacterized protein MYCFIDRAFT_211390 [Pseudocercospora fijiensis CIRAD86]EME83688.1 hypothetical protein MYCFIDRAFT_211390 [Pseudocercospora fijiensis CIRAD86]
MNESTYSRKSLHVAEVMTRFSIPTPSQCTVSVRSLRIRWTKIMPHISPSHPLHQTKIYLFRNLTSHISNPPSLFLSPTIPSQPPCHLTVSPSLSPQTTLSISPPPPLIPFLPPLLSNAPSTPSPQPPPASSSGSTTKNGST